MAEVVLNEQSEKLFSDFLISRKILIADPIGSSRSGLAKMLVGLGAKSNNLILIDNYPEALLSVRESQPEIIITEFALGRDSGLDLSEETKNYKNKEEKIFVLVTSNSSQAAVAQAAEEDVDVFILKPYTIKGFSDLFTRTVIGKVYPSDYIKTIRRGKALLESGDAEGALTEFTKAVTLNEKPTLAYYYLAQTKLYKKLLSEAEMNYNAGLQVNNLHFKCLSGIFDLLVSQKRNADAYAVVKQLSKIFPANPDRLGQVLSLAISTGNFIDIEEYYESFKEIETRNDDLVRYVCASLVICGKHFFRQNQREKALEFLKKASVTAAGKALILREIITVLVTNDVLVEAQEVLKRFGDHERNDVHFLVSSFMITNALEDDKVKLIPPLRKLVSDGIKEPVIWYWLIFYLVEFDKMIEAESMYDEAVKQWPEREEYFKAALAIEEEE